MKYFTRQLWIAFQGPRSKAAFKTWDLRYESYRKELEKILPDLGPSARKFFRDVLTLHDGTLTRLEVGDFIDVVEGKATRTETVNRRKVGVRLTVLGEIVKQQRVIGHRWYVITYKGVERIELDFPGPVELFAAGSHPNFGDWGYDELTSPKKDVFRHEILFSSGATITIDFRDVSVRHRPA